MQEQNESTKKEKYVRVYLLFLHNDDECGFAFKMIDTAVTLARGNTGRRSRTNKKISSYINRKQRIPLPQTPA